MIYYLAIDIGASSGRHILGCITADGKIALEEVHRFSNGMKEKNGHLCWDIEILFSEIKKGLAKCAEIGKIPKYMGIDTWAVDFVLLDKEQKILGNCVGYRDKRTKNMDLKVSEIISQQELYKRTGIQKQIFNTIYQLMSIKVDNPEQLEKAEHMLMVPEYLNYLLTGIIKNEYTNATTTQLVSPESKSWDHELMDMLGFPRKIFGELSLPGTVIGELSEEIQREIGFNCTVLLPPTHDTASSVLATPSEEEAVYISSGTWSLMGVELEKANCTLESEKANFSNEGGYDYRFRYLKNIMGLWMIQCVRHEYDDRFSFAQLCEGAAGESIGSIVDCNDGRFLAPDSMIREIQDFCRENGKTVPQTPFEVSAVVYNSLAKCYADTLREIEQLTGKRYSKIHIIGGGANADYLNRLTAKSTGRLVCCGPTESTATGNIVSQMIYTGQFKDIFHARKCIKESFKITEYQGEECYD